MNRENPEQYKARNLAATESSPAPSFVLNRANEGIGQRRRGRRIDEEKERQTMELYADKKRKRSMRKVAAELGIGHTTVRRILIRNNKPRRSASEALMKYPKTDFSSDPTERARILGFIEDCSAGYASKQLHVQTSTTHPAQMKLFNDIFGRYGHVSRTPEYNKQQSCYQWKQRVFLNSSFGFLREYKESPMRYLVEISESGYKYDCIAGQADAESWVGIDANSGHPRANLEITNNNRQLLEWTQGTIGGRIVRSRDVYKLYLYHEQAVEVLRRLPITHAEKVAAKELILYYADNRGIGVEALRAYEELRRKIDEDVQRCKLEARLEYIRRHGKPHSSDPDQTIPQSY